MLGIDDADRLRAAMHLLRLEPASPIPAPGIEVEREADRQPIRYTPPHAPARGFGSGDSQPPRMQERAIPEELPADRDPEFTRDPPDWLLTTAPMPEPIGAGTILTPPPPLVPPAVARAFAAATAATTAEDGPVDVEAVVTCMAARRPVGPLPRHRVPTLRQGVQLLEDWGEAMMPFYDDVRALRQEMRTVVGRERVRALRFAGDPYRVGSGPESGWTRYEPPPPMVPVVAVTDLGLSGATDAVSPKVWLAFAKWLRGRGNPLVILTPNPSDEWPAPLRRIARFVFWQAVQRGCGAIPAAVHTDGEFPVAEPSAENGPGQRLAALLKKEHPDLHRLARALSLAVRIEPVLLRRMRERILPHAPPSLEARLWVHPAVEVRNPVLFQFWPEVQSALRSTLAEDRALLDTAWAVLKEVHADAAPAFRLEEEVAYMALSGAAPERLDALLRPALAALAQSGRDQAVATWALRALPEMPDAAHRAPTYAHLLAAAAKTRGVPIPGHALKAVALQDLGWLAAPSGESVAIDVEWTGRGLALRYPSDESGRVIRAPAGKPILLEVRWKDGRGRLTVEVLPNAPVHLDLDLGSEVEIATQDGRLYRLRPQRRDVLRWLHLADLHASSRSPSLEPFFRRLVKEMDIAGAPDFVFITGDIADTGQAGEYERFALTCLNPLRAALGPDWRGRIYCVPGNHDYDRAAGSLPIYLSDPPDSFFHIGAEGRGLRTLFEEAFAHYMEFERKQTDAPSGWMISDAGTYADKVTVRGRTVGIVGINTAWFSQGQQSQEWLEAGPGLLTEALMQVEDCERVFVIGHHGLRYLRDGKELGAQIERHGALYLHGHEDEEEVPFDRAFGALALLSGRYWDAADDRPRHVRVTRGELEVDGGAVHLTVHVVKESRRCPSKAKEWHENGPPARQVEWLEPPPPEDLTKRTAFRRRIARRVDGIAAGTDTKALFSLWRMMPAVDGVPQYARSEWTRLIPEFGPAIARAVRTGLVAAWQNWMPDPPTGGGGEVPILLVLGLSGLSILANEDFKFATLSEAEAKAAATYAFNEINRFPDWLAALADAHPHACDRAFRAGVSRTFASAEGSLFLHNLLASGSAIMQRFAPVVWDTLLQGEPAHPDVLCAALTIALLNGDPVATVAAERAGRTRATASHDALWFAAWLWLDARRAVQAFHRFVGTGKSFDAIALELCARLEEGWAMVVERSPDFLHPHALGELLTIVVAAVRRAEDRRIGDDDFVDGRARAQLFRDRMVNRLIWQNSRIADKRAPDDQRQRQTRIFISYTGSDRAMAREVAVGLKRRGIPYFMEDESGLKGQAVFQTIRDEISKATHFLLIASPESLTSQWVASECKAAVELSAKGELVVIPALLGLDAQALPPSLRDMVTVNLKYLEAALDLVATLCPQTQAPAGPPADDTDTEHEVDDETRKILEHIIRDKLADRFDNFYPSHYGCSIDEIYLDETARYKGGISVNGAVSAVARLGSSREEDAMDINYYSDFEANFLVHAPAEAEGTKGVTLDKLILEKSEWIDPDDSARAADSEGGGTD